MFLIHTNHISSAQVRMPSVLDLEHFIITKGPEGQHDHGASSPLDQSQETKFQS